MKLFLYNALILTVAALEGLQPNPLTDDFINSINEKQSTWRAGRNFNINTPLTQLRKLAGVIPSKEGKKPNFSTKIHSKIATPEYFDARQQWPKCVSIGEIQDQGPCSSDWVLAPVGVMSDRICIVTKGTLPITVSAEDLLTCQDCGLYVFCGCQGNLIDAAWQYWRDFGIVTGGSYGSGIGCKSYTVPPCEFDEEPCNSEQYLTPECYRYCDNNSRRIYNEDLTTGIAYNLPAKDQEQMKIEIMTKGPVQAIISMFSDFLTYKSGVYRQTKGYFIGLHAIKILGWGVEQDNPYWLAANSWGSQWGDRGFFKISRGEDECSIESLVMGADPIL